MSVNKFGDIDDKPNKQILSAIASNLNVFKRSGEYNFNSKRLSNVSNPQNDTDAVNKRYLDENVTKKLQDRDATIHQSIVTAFNSENAQINEPKFENVSQKIESLNTDIREIARKLEEQFDDMSKKINYLNTIVPKILENIKEYINEHSKSLDSLTEGYSKLNRRIKP